MRKWMVEPEAIAQLTPQPHLNHFEALYEFFPHRLVKLVKVNDLTERCSGREIVILFEIVGVPRKSKVATFPQHRSGCFAVLNYQAMGPELCKLIINEKIWLRVLALPVGVQHFIINKTSRLPVRRGRLVVMG
ncbi:hypothetical protein QP963_08595 [Corynebacterium coyleae]|nr:hypothetical protein [Corynebacterium coyleae]MDK8663532.1 hypothetical protein [Corynebacterium coyleae]MDK8707458.1 hypothetical protein [Corynebacterium coyleae]MDK8734306.1 hypothetical protein [Corynebacterium coyleae]MDK8893553.1 hypothetical protein [Corynebacterium coyleae]